MNYRMFGHYPLIEGRTHDGNLLLSWGLWDEPEASNDDKIDEPPGRA